MARYLGKEMNRQEILRRVGNIEQIARIRAAQLLGGRGNGCKTLEVATGGGLEFTVLQDRCLDLADFRYKGVNLSFLAKPGLVAPQYFNPAGQFCYYFQAGMLYTCGLRNVGLDPEGPDGEPLHGRIGGVPAEHCCSSAAWEGDEYVLKVSGDMRQSSLFGENLLLSRRMETRLGANSVKISDQVSNENCTSEGLMLLYHLNLGYPLLGPQTRLLLPEETKTQPRDDEAAKGIGSFRKFSEPIDSYREQCFYHRLAALPDGTACAVVHNRELGLALWVKFNTNCLPMMTQWKSMASGDYVLGLEPANCHVEGRTKEKRGGTLQTLEPFGSAEFGVEIGVLEGSEIDEFVGNCGQKLC